MIVSIHQPQYLPWLPYFSKIAKADVFVFLDGVQFQKNGLQNRNQLKNNNGPFWLTVPVSAHLGDKIKDIKIANNNWEKKHIKSIYYNYQKSVFFSFFENNIQNILSEGHEYLVDLNIKIIKTICSEIFEIKTKFYKQSDLEVGGKNSELILNICKKLKASRYMSGPNGKKYLNHSEFQQNNIQIDYFKNTFPEEYNQLHKKIGFIKELSALDFILCAGRDWKRYYTL